MTLEQKGGKGTLHAGHYPENSKSYRQLSRTMEALQTAEDGGEQQKGLLQKTGEILADIVGTNLSTADTETEIEFNFAVVKIKHKVIRSN